MKVTYVSDSYATPALRQIVGSDAEVIAFAVADPEESMRAGIWLLDQLDPDLLLSIERCSRSRDDTYLNMRSVDISDQTARLDYLFESDIPSVGIGDGGNEIGMGNLAPNNPHLCQPAAQSSHKQGRPPGGIQRLQLGRLRSGGRPVPAKRQKHAPDGRP